jgi:hypothetical protein
MRNRKTIAALAASGITVVLIALGIAVASPAHAASVSEIMTDRCSSDVWIAQDYNAGPMQGQGLLLARNTSSYNWVGPMPVNGHSWIRWWCHSTTGNWLDPGTWRIDGINVSVGCNSSLSSCNIAGGGVDLNFNASGGWTAERSRCGSGSTRAIHARLGPNRLLQMACVSP